MYSFGRSGPVGKNDLNICIVKEKSYQNDELFFMGIEMVLKLQASVIFHYIIKPVWEFGWSI